MSKTCSAKWNFTAIVFLVVSLMFSFLFVACGDDEEGVTSDKGKAEEGYENDAVYSIPQDVLGDWDEGFVKYNVDNEDQSFYVTSKYDAEECMRIIYLGQLNKDFEGYYVYCDSLNNVLALKGNGKNYFYNGYTGIDMWSVYDDSGTLIYTFDMGAVSLYSRSTRSMGDNLYTLYDLCKNAGLGFHHEWGDLAANVGLGLALKALRLSSWPIQLAVEVFGYFEKAENIQYLYDGCIPSVVKCQKSGEISVNITGINNLKNTFTVLKYDEITQQFKLVEYPGKQVYMGVAIKKQDSYVTYSNCDNHTQYVKLNSGQSNIFVNSPIDFKPGITYYLRPYLIENTLFNSPYNTYRQRYIQYGDTYEFRYTIVTITDMKQLICYDYSDTQYIAKASITAKIESLDDLSTWGVSIYTKDNEFIKELECYSSTGKSEKEFIFEDYLDKGLFKNNKATLLVVPFSKDKEGNYAYGEGKNLEIFSYTCPDSNHPHWIDLGLPSGTQWRCCNEGASTPEAYGGYYTFDQVSSAPTIKQIIELLDNCSSVWTTQNGVKGRKFKGRNGGTIFLPAAGLRYEDGWISSVGSGGTYRSSTPYGENGAYALHFVSYRVHWYCNYYPSYGYSVRPVR